MSVCRMKLRAKLIMKLALLILLLLASTLPTMAEVDGAGISVRFQTTKDRLEELKLKSEILDRVFNKMGIDKPFTIDKRIQSAEKHLKKAENLLNKIPDPDAEKMAIMEINSASKDLEHADRAFRVLLDYLSARMDNDQQLLILSIESLKEQIYEKEKELNSLPPVFRPEKAKFYIEQSKKFLEEVKTSRAYILLSKECLAIASDDLSAAKQIFAIASLSLPIGIAGSIIVSLEVKAKRSGKIGPLRKIFNKIKIFRKIELR